MPDGDGLEATVKIKFAIPHIKIIILSVSDNVQDFFEAIKRSTQGYLLKNMEPEYWLDYIVSIVQGNSHIPGAGSQNPAGICRSEAGSYR